MKRFIFLLVLAFFSATLAVKAQATFTAEDLAKLGISSDKITALSAEKQIDQKLETYGKWAGLGKEIGTAVNESLSSLTKTAGDFSETKLGRFTMFLVAYKVIGTDMLQVGFGVLWVLLVIGASGFVHFSYGRTKRVLRQVNYGPEGKVLSKSYETVTGDDEFRVTATVMLIVGLLISIPVFLV